MLNGKPKSLNRLAVMFAWETEYDLNLKYRIFYLFIIRIKNAKQLMKTNVDDQRLFKYILEIPDK